MFTLINRWPRCPPASEVEKARGPGHLAAVIGYTEAIKSTLRTIICNPHVLPSSKRIICSSLHPRPRQRGSYQHRNPTPPYLMTIFRKHSLSQTISSFLSPLVWFWPIHSIESCFTESSPSLIFCSHFYLCWVACGVWVTVSVSRVITGGAVLLNIYNGCIILFYVTGWPPSSPRPAYHVTTHLHYLQHGSRSIQPRRAPASLIIHNEE